MEPKDAPRWTDCHNHVQLLPMADSDAVLAAMSRVGVVRCVVNATREEEWGAVEELAVAWPERVVPAFGIHPWHAGKVATGWEERLRSLLARHPGAGVGECGLDGLAAVAQPVQRQVFETQLGIARELGRVLTIHCVGGWNGLFEALTKEPPPPRFLMHAYSGSVETALRLARMGAWFSFNGSFLEARRRKAVETFRKLPLGRVVVETDAPTGLPPTEWVSHPLPGQANHPANLPRIGIGLAAALGREVDELAERMERNAVELLGH